MTKDQSLKDTWLNAINQGKDETKWNTALSFECGQQWTSLNEHNSSSINTCKQIQPCPSCGALLGNAGQDFFEQLRGKNYKPLMSHVWTELIVWILFFLSGASGFQQLSDYTLKYDMEYSDEECCHNLLRRGYGTFSFSIMWARALCLQLNMWDIFLQIICLTIVTWTDSIVEGVLYKLTCRQDKLHFTLC